MPFFERLADRLDLDDFDKRHKTAFVVLACAAVLFIALWVLKLQSDIVNPLYGGVNPKSLQATSQTLDSDAKLKSTDTDADGLSDWDELNFYKTSAYLADSDSDTISDREEIEKGSDPNCPTGQICSAATEQNTGAEISPVDSGLGVMPTQTAAPSTSSNNSTLTAEEKEALKKIIGTSNDPSVLRAFLLQSGADQEYINSLSDADLQSVINEILK
jgi:hypothetical protein